MISENCVYSHGYLPHDHMDLQHLNILYHVFHGSVVAGDFALCDEMVVESMAAGSLIAMLDDAYLKIIFIRCQLYSLRKIFNIFYRFCTYLSTNVRAFSLILVKMIEKTHDFATRVLQKQ